MIKNNEVPRVVWTCKIDNNNYCSTLLKLINNSSRENKENHYRDRGLDM